MNSLILHRLTQLIIFALIVLATGYAVSTRTADEFISDATPIAVFLAFICYGFFLSNWSLGGGPPNFTKQIPLLLMLYIPLVVFSLTLMYWGIWITLKDSSAWYQDLPLVRWVFVCVIGIAVIGLAYVLFRFRLYARFFYGLTESITGLVIAIRNVPDNPNFLVWHSDTYFLILTAGIFLLVRGFDNMHTGLKKESRDGVLSEFDESIWGRTYAQLARGNSTKVQE